MLVCRATCSALARTIGNVTYRGEPMLIYSLDEVIILTMHENINQNRARTFHEALNKPLTKANMKRITWIANLTTISSIVLTTTWIPKW